MLSMLIEQRAIKYGPVPAGSDEAARFFSPDQSPCGIQVNEQTAMSYTAWYACVRVIAETLASLPLQVYERTGDRRRGKAVDHPYNELFNESPNGYTPAMATREATQAHTLGWGNGYYEIERDGGQRAVGLHLIGPNRVTPEYVRLPSGRTDVVYLVADPDNQKAKPTVLPSSNVVHITGLGFDGLVGYSPVRMFGESIGLGLSAEAFAKQFYDAGASPIGVVQHPLTLSPAAQERIQGNLQRIYGGLRNAHRIAVLEEGMSWNKVGVDPETAQMLDTRSFSRREMASIHRCPLHLIGDLERATWDNIEQQGIDFVVHCLRPWGIRWEQQLQWKLFDPAERKRYYIRHNFEALLRGDIRSRFEAFSIAKRNGWMNATQICQLEDIEPPPNDLGDVYVIEANMQRLDAMPTKEDRAAEQANKLAAVVSHADEPSPPAAEPPAAKRSADLPRIARSFEPLFVEGCRRALRKESAKLANLSKQGTMASFEKRAGTFWGEHSAYVREAIEPLIVSCLDVLRVASSELAAEPLAAVDELRSTLTDRYVAGYLERSAEAAALAVVDPIGAAAAFERWPMDRGAIEARSLVALILESELWTNSNSELSLTA